MSTGRTSFEIALPGPSLDNPVLFDRHASRIEAVLRERFPPASGCRVTTHKESGPKDRSWEVRLHQGWLSGARVVLRPLADTPHRAQVQVDWDSRLFNVLVVVLGVAGVPLALLVLLAGVFVFRRLLFSLLVVGVLGFAWLFLAALLAHLLARLVALLARDEFDSMRRSQLAEQLMAVPLQTRLEG